MGCQPGLEGEDATDCGEWSNCLSLQLIMLRNNRQVSRLKRKKKTTKKKSHESSYFCPIHLTRFYPFTMCAVVKEGGRAQPQINSALCVPCRALPLRLDNDICLACGHTGRLMRIKSYQVLEVFPHKGPWGRWGEVAPEIGALQKEECTVIGGGVWGQRLIMGSSSWQRS